MPGFMDPLGELPSSAENSDSDFDEADIPENLRATLHVKQKPAAEVKPVTFVRFKEVDVVRHPLVQQIVRAFDRHERSGK